MPSQEPAIPRGDLNEIGRLMRERALPDWQYNSGDAPGQGCGFPSRIAGHGVVVQFPPHMVDLLTSIDQEEAKAFRELLKLRPETIKWLSNKSPTEIGSVDDAITLVNQTKLATRVLLVAISSSATIIGIAWAITQWGWNAFWFIKGSKP